MGAEINVAGRGVAGTAADVQATRTRRGKMGAGVGIVVAVDDGRGPVTGGFQAGPFKVVGEHHPRRGAGGTEPNSTLLSSRVPSKRRQPDWRTPQLTAVHA